MEIVTWKCLIDSFYSAIYVGKISHEFQRLFISHWSKHNLRLCLEHVKNKDETKKLKKLFSSSHCLKLKLKEDWRRKLKTMQLLVWIFSPNYFMFFLFSFFITSKQSLRKMLNHLGWRAGFCRLHKNTGRDVTFSAMDYNNKWILIIARIYLCKF